MEYISGNNFSRICSEIPQKSPKSIINSLVIKLEQLTEEEIDAVVKY